VKHLAHQVQELKMTFEDRPFPDDLDLAIEVIGALPNLRKLRLAGESKNWWKPWEGKGKKKDLTDLRKVITQAQDLRVLILPRLSFDPINTYHLLDSLKRLERFKGELSAPRDGSLPPLNLSLTDLNVIHHNTRRDLEFYLTASFLTLRYLRLHFDGFVPLISLSALTNLAHLVTTIEPSRLLSVPFPSGLILTSLKSCQELPNLSSLTLNLRSRGTLDASILTLTSQFVISGLPRNIETLAVGPHAFRHFPGRGGFLDHARSRYPRLTTLKLGANSMRMLGEGVNTDASRNETMFQVSDVKGAYGIDVQWLKGKAWEGRLDRDFAEVRDF